MIARISGDRQYELSDDQWRELEQLDNDAVAAVDAGDEARFRSLWDRIVSLVSGGRPLEADELAVSDLILPPHDLSLDEARAEFTGDGLIPG